MEIMHLFNAVVLNHFGQTYDVSLNWIAQIIEWLISGIGIVGVGIIVFSLLLKVIVLPFDIYQRITMRKQNNKMQENQEKMEKLQKQYANDKEKYNQKVMEMYKENGISMFSSCLPMILSMIVFIAAIGGFNSYAKYANIQNYNSFVNTYNEKIEEFAPELSDEGTNVDFAWKTETDEAGNQIQYGEFTVRNADNLVYLTVRSEKDYTTESKEAWNAYVSSVLKYEVKDSAGKLVKAQYNADVDATFAQYSQLTKTGDVDTDEKTVQNFYHELAREAVRKDYEENSFDRVGFLWIKNVWNVDAVYEHPITEHAKMMEPVKNLFSAESRFNVNGTLVSFKDVQAMDASPYKDTSFKEITTNLKDGKEAPNGYFIMIVLSIGTILLQQFISMRSQKAQNKYSSVDGQQAATQKTTMIIMTVMFGIFSFMYSAAFSIYMVVSSIFSLGSTMLINKLVDISMSKKEEKAMQEKFNRTLPGQNKDEDKKEKKEKKNKQDKQDKQDKQQDKQDNKKN